MIKPNTVCDSYSETREEVNEKRFYREKWMNKMRHICEDNECYLDEDHPLKKTPLPRR